jgi:hypothetical protein
MDLGMLFRLESKPGNENDLARAIAGPLAAGLDELSLSGWQAVRFSGTSFGLWVAYTDSNRLGDEVAALLRDELLDLLDATPSLESFDVLAASWLSRARSEIPPRAP